MVTSNIRTTFLRLAFDLLYHRLAWTYDIVAAIASAGRWRQWIRTIYPYITGPRILELGYGPGHLLAELTSSHYEAVGIDESFQMTRLARRNTRSGQDVHKTKIHWPVLIRGKAQTLPFPAKIFTSIVSTFPSPYIFDPKSISEIERVLVPGGRLVIAVGAEITGRKITDRFSAWLSKKTYQTVDWNVTFDKYFEKSSLFVKVITCDCKTSKVLLIVAEKSNHEMSGI